MKLVILEGPDGVGKSTISEMLQERLDAALFSFPGTQDGTIGKWIYDLHHNKYAQISISPTVLQSLHIAAHLDVIERMAVAVQTGHVVLDGHFFSTLVYGSLYGANPKVLTRLVDAEEAYWVVNGLYEHDCIVIFLDREQPFSDFEQGMEKWLEIRNQYVAFFNAVRSNLSIGCVQLVNENSEETAEKILGIVASLANA